MAYYLSMDGVDDYLQAPSITFDKVVIDGTFNTSASQQYIIHITLGGSGYSRIQGGASVAAYNAFTGTGFTIDTRSTHEISRSPFTASASNLRFCASNTGTAFARADVYDIKFYNGATLVAHYDMTTQTVLDQSGNGNDATLTGGTWVDEGGGTTHEASASLTATGSLTAVGTLYKLGSASLQGTSSLSATAEKTLLASASLQGTSSLTADSSLTIMGGASLAGTSALAATGFVGGIITGSASLVGTSSLSATAISGAQIARLINLLGSKPLPISLFGEKPSSVNLLGGWMATIAVNGAKPLPVSLEGGLMTTKTNQDFTMYAGDTPPFTINMSDSTSLTGATVEWVMRRGHVKGTLAVTKSTTDGIAVSGTAMTITLASADTLALEGKYYHEAEVTDVSGLVSTVSTGTITILPSGT